MINLKNKLICISIVIGIILNTFIPVILAVEEINNIDEAITNNKTIEDTEIAEDDLKKDNETNVNEIKDEKIENKENLVTNNISNEININENKTNNVIDEVKNQGNITTNIEEDNEKSKIIEEKTTESNNTQLENDESLIMPLALDDEPNVTYKTHIQNVGWQGDKTSGQSSGTEGKSLRLEAISIKTEDMPSNIKIKYQVHVQNIGWQDWKQDGQVAGTEGKSLRLEAIRIKLETSEDYSIMYRTHIQNIGWQNWKTDGEISGTEGKALRMEAIQIKIVKKAKKGKIYIDTPTNGTTYNRPKTISISGWKMANISDTKINVYVDGITTPIDESLIKYTQRADVLKSIVDCGTSSQNPNPGFTISVDAKNMKTGKHSIRIVLVDKNNQKITETTSTINVDNELHIEYSSHIQGIGWQGYRIDGNLSGTEGRGLRLEAIVMKLVNAPSNGKIRYRTHIQNIGWQGWKTSNDLSGTEGKSLRIEAIEITLENMNEYTVEYQVHVQNVGWTQWFIDGETAGTVGQSKRIEAIRIRIVPKYKRNYKGIDVSQFNGNINWGFVKRDNVDFAFIRVGYRGYGEVGNFAEDIMFERNMQAAKAAGIPVGVYFVTQATTEAEAVEEANWVLQKLKGYDIEYPVAIDIEKSSGNPGRADNLDKQTRTKLANIFCKTIQNSGYIPIIYANINWAENYLDMSQLSEYDTWIAQYKYDINSKPDYNKKYSIWQYSNSGSINGILGNVDLNVCYKKY